MIDAIIYACLGMIIFAGIAIIVMCINETWKERKDDKQMTKEEAIKRIEKMVEDDDELGCLFIRKDIEALNMAISALKGGWIPVKVALPEEGRSVLVCFKSQGGMAQAVSERFNISGEWRWSALGGRKPLAWQPLPEPYKKGE